MSTPQEILDFWFGRPGEPEYGRPRAIWWEVTPEFVEEASNRFLVDFEAAADGRLSSWEETPEGRLALILLLDQFSLLLFRDTRGAFATDPEARRVARLAVEQGDDQRFPDYYRWFHYLPFEHSENQEDQALSVRLHRTLPPNDDNRMALDYAYRHQRVVERFGRFPNRNAALGRESTPEELEFLAGPDAPF
jgi:uncharacterized protein (DUF924 family)